jgi:hypothetical protein
MLFKSNPIEDAAKLPCDPGDRMDGGKATEFPQYPHLRVISPGCGSSGAPQAGQISSLVVSDISSPNQPKMMKIIVIGIAYWKRMPFASTNWYSGYIIPTVTERVPAQKK